jgi:hypothetical protein
LLLAGDRSLQGVDPRRDENRFHSDSLATVMIGSKAECQPLGQYGHWPRNCAIPKNRSCSRLRLKGSHFSNHARHEANENPGDVQT